MLATSRKETGAASAGVLASFRDSLLYIARAQFAGEFQKCDLGFEFIFSTNSGVTSKCSVLASGGSQGDPGTDVGTGKGGADKIGPQNKGGLISKPKRRNKK